MLRALVHRLSRVRTDEVTRAAWVLLEPFEFSFPFIAAQHQFELDRRLTAPALGACVAAPFTIKLFEEYAIHHACWFDGFTAVEAVESIWAWVMPF
jgi:hypothetical protein